MSSNRRSRSRGVDDRPVVYRADNNMSRSQRVDYDGQGGGASGSGDGDGEILRRNPREPPGSTTYLNINQTGSQLAQHYPDYAYGYLTSNFNYNNYTPAASATYTYKNEEYDPAPALGEDEDRIDRYACSQEIEFSDDDDGNGDRDIFSGPIKSRVNVTTDKPETEDQADGYHGGYYEEEKRDKKKKLMEYSESSKLKRKSEDKYQYDQIAHSSKKERGYETVTMEKLQKRREKGLIYKAKIKEEPESPSIDTNHENAAVDFESSDNSTSTSGSDESETIGEKLEYLKKCYENRKVLKIKKEKVSDEDDEKYKPEEGSISIKEENGSSPTYVPTGYVPNYDDDEGPYVPWGDSDDEYIEKQGLRYSPTRPGLGQ